MKNQYLFIFLYWITFVFLGITIGVTAEMIVVGVIGIFYGVEGSWLYTITQLGLMFFQICLLFVYKKVAKVDKV